MTTVPDRARPCLGEVQDHDRDRASVPRPRTGTVTVGMCDEIQPLTVPDTHGPRPHPTACTRRTRLGRSHRLRTMQPFPRRTARSPARCRPMTEGRPPSTAPASWALGRWIAAQSRTETHPHQSTAPLEVSVTYKPPACPREIGAAGRKVWRATVARFELEAHEIVVLTELCRAKDRLDALDALIRRDGLVVDGGRSGAKANPALVESRQLQIVAARLGAALRFPQGDDGEQSTSARPRRGGARGPYAIRGGAA